MAYFRLRNDAEDWFKKVEKGPKFDVYYYCVIIGILNNNRNEPAGVVSTDIVSNFINDYKAYQNLIIGLLIISELKKVGINISEKDAVRKELQSLLSPQGETGLSDRGVQLLNHYASGGFEHIRDSKSTKPESRDEFMLDFIEMVGQAAEKLRF
jgi:hypothetical protein